MPVRIAAARQGPSFRSLGTNPIRRALTPALTPGSRRDTRPVGPIPTDSYLAPADGFRPPVGCAVQYLTLTGRPAVPDEADQKLIPRGIGEPQVMVLAGWTDWGRPCPAVNEQNDARESADRLPGDPGCAAPRICEHRERRPCQVERHEQPALRRADRIASIRTRSSPIASTALKLAYWSGVSRSVRPRNRGAPFSKRTLRMPSRTCSVSR